MSRPVRPNFHALWFMQEAGAVGEWRHLSLLAIGTACGVSRQQARNIIQNLIDLGWIEYCPAIGQKGGEVRVIRTIESKPSEAVGEFIPLEKRKKLIRYAGWEKGASSW